MLGFAVVLAISAASMAHLPISASSRSSAGVAAYRKSVTEADLARNIDRELISYRALVRYYVATGKEEDSKAAQAAEGGLKNAIDQSMRGTTNPARLDQVTKLAREFSAFTKIFAEILKPRRTTRVSRPRTRSPAARCRWSTSSTISPAPRRMPTWQAIAFQAKTSGTQFQSIKVFDQLTSCVSGDAAGGDQRDQPAELHRERR